MVAATAYVVCYFIYHYVQNAHDEYVSWTNRIHDMEETGLMDLVEPSDRPFSAKWWAISVLLSGLTLILGVIIAGIFYAVSSEFMGWTRAYFPHGVNDEASDGMYGIAKSSRNGEIVSSELDSVIRKVGLGNICEFDFRDITRAFSMSILFHRMSDNDIEEDRDKAGSEMALYRVNPIKADENYWKYRNKQRFRFRANRVLSGFAYEVRNYFHMSKIRIGNLPLFTLDWILRHWFIITCTVMLLVHVKSSYSFESPLNRLICYTSEDYCSLLISSWSVLSYIVIRVVEFQRSCVLMEILRSTNEYDESENPNYKKSTSDFLDFTYSRYWAIEGEICSPSYHILDIFQAFLDLHKEGWRMKIFPFSAERVRQEKADAAARGEEIVIFPDVDEIEARLAEEERKEQRIASIGEL